ncbi:hypothetical protein COS78_04440 [Candidatus Shapirobacteria bacterium CG06_land_8_20_14_3_00_40_12]|uniref:Uncharacterized protein n=1 Tax=Candidatus Shapirobacteria bacterium CG06_land_8_20_14_3_00_40_12 TaxID=1974881 RepID=A0A2M7AR07_9BACT|nr:MAG: hypothetical protein COS78_04440 [Candidatus Shapirobacteria bacterium CG06_land_8_20_14_3_00_40_12]
MKKFWLILFLVLLFEVKLAVAVMAGPMLKLSPGSGTYNNGSTFEVTIQVDSGTAKSMAVDAWLTFDANKLEVVSIENPASPAFANTMGKNIYNSDGKMDMSFNASGDSTLSESTVIKGDLAVIKFRAKNTGTAQVNFTCQSGSSIDTNIFDIQSVDVIDCASNQNGSYTITGGGSEPISTPVPPQATVTPNDGSGAELPQTGSVGTTIGLLIFGIVGLIAGTILKWL